ncbi:hypothetical protein [uncultured Christiangramia sp.]|uniref:hypothetical protein n=1 Tax=uncultured Christiangramia sp. TaxID=503836 RepID=UPI00260FFAA7|nr:hypothetical protein [uncultured Christiangramia sp.]
MRFQTIIGDKIKGRIPEEVLENVLLSFKDHDLNFEEDLQHCDMRINERGICWIHDVSTRTQFWKGTPIANFNIDGSHFWFTKAVHRNTEKVGAYQKARSEFFKVPRTARELEQFELHNRR